MNTYVLCYAVRMLRPLNSGPAALLEAEAINSCVNYGTINNFISFISDRLRQI